MGLLVRALKPEETRTFLQVHHNAVRGTAAADYPMEVIEAWAPMPITAAMVETVLASADQEIRLAALSDGQIVGIGVVLPEARELRACYVSPAAGRNGVGRQLVGEMERLAYEQGAPFLALDASFGAEPFYARLGYRTLGRGEHTLHSGARMGCVMMRKDLTGGRVRVPLRRP